MNHSISDKDLDILNYCIDNTGFLSMDLENGKHPTIPSTTILKNTR